MKTLRDYQKKSLEIFSQDSSGLDGSDMGTGKTLVGVERVRDIEFAGPAPRVLIIAPLNTHSQWMPAFAEQYPDLAGSEFLRVVETPRSDPEGWRLLTNKSPGVFIMGWEAMRGSVPQETRRAGSNSSKKNPGITVAAIKKAMKDGQVPPWTRTGTFDLVIADESHRIANRGSLQYKVIKLIKAHNKRACSATPAGNSPEGLWGTLNWLWPDQYPSFWGWVTEHLETREQYIGGGKTAPQIVGEKYPGSTWTDIPCKVRWRIEKVASQLPEVIKRVVMVPMGDIQRRIYDEFEQQAFAWLDDQPVATPLPLTQRIRLRQAALGHLKMTEVKRRQTVWVERSALDRLRAAAGVGDIRILDASEDGTQVRISSEFDDTEIGFNERGDQPKLQAVKEILRDLPDSEPVLIFTHSAKWARMAAASIDDAKVYGEARAWTGDLSSKQREGLKSVFGKMAPNETKGSFSHDGIRVIVAVIPAVAEGLDGWQHVCRCEIWASPSEDGLMNRQAEGRLHRPGQSVPVQRWILHSDDSIDTDVAGTLERRRKMMSVFYQDNKQ